MRRPSRFRRCSGPSRPSSSSINCARRCSSSRRRSSSRSPSPSSPFREMSKAIAGVSHINSPHAISMLISYDGVVRDFHSRRLSLQRGDARSQVGHGRTLLHAPGHRARLSRRPLRRGIRGVLRRPARGAARDPCGILRAMAGSRDGGAAAAVRLYLQLSGLRRRKPSDPGRAVVHGREPDALDHGDLHGHGSFSGVLFRRLARWARRPNTAGSSRSSTRMAISPISKSRAIGRRTSSTRGLFRWRACFSGTV